MSHLFKLKKTGKTVGFLKIEGGRVLLNPVHRPGYWCAYDGQLCKDLFDIAHLFVCKDKNGKDVFADDPCLLHCFSPPKKVYPKWNQEYLRFELWADGSAVMSATGDTYERHVELIKEEQE